MELFEFYFYQWIKGFSSIDIDLKSKLGGDYMISVSRDEILSRFAGIPAVL